MLRKRQNVTYASLYEKYYKDYETQDRISRGFAPTGFGLRIATWFIVLVIVVAVVVLAGVTFLIIFLVKRKKKKAQTA
ncbi:MAG: hypothetical protein IIW16_04390 [Clostridia bacterium]|nr:hypothetical protein [Clostridia bacterium]MBQ5799037.1 hypothetical protein [Clostridia bacterium]